MGYVFKRVVGGLALIAGILFSTEASPQTAQLALPPIKTYVDNLGVDLLSLSFPYEETDVSVGSAESGLAHTRQYFTGSYGLSHNYMIRLAANGLYSDADLSIGNRTIHFNYDPANLGTFTPKLRDGTKLDVVWDNYQRVISATFTDRDGTVITLISLTPYAVDGNIYSYYGSFAAIGKEIRKPNGEIITLHYKPATYTQYYNCAVHDNLGTCQTIAFYALRLQSVTSTTGYMLKYKYMTNTPDPVSFNSPLQGFAGIDSWATPAGVQAINLSTNYCDPDQDGPCANDNGSVAYSINTVDLVQNGSSYSGQEIFVTKPDGRQERITTGRKGGLATLRPYGSTSDLISFRDGGDGHGVNLGVPNLTTSYGTGPGYIVAGSSSTIYPYNPGPYRGIEIDSNGFVISDTVNANTAPFSPIYEVDFTNDSYGRPVRADIYRTGGGSYSTVTIGHAYDSRGNVTQTSLGAVNPYTETASFDATCTNPVTCNKPNSTTDALGNVTTYTYDSTTGLPLTITGPAATSGGVQSQVRNSYTQLFSYIKNASGSIVASPTGIYKLTATSTCLTTASCTGTSDELKTTYNYGSTGVANTLLLTSKSTGSGDGALTATTAWTYDAVGNRLTEDGPLAGAADTTTWIYDAYRRVTQVVSADPDGAGSRKNVSVKTTYNEVNKPIVVANGTSNADGSGFVESSRVESIYDTNWWKISDRAVVSGVIQSRTDYQYDGWGKQICVAVRMNPAVFATSAATGCTLGTQGSQGPDRIKSITYDTLDRPVVVYSSFGLSSQRADATYTYGYSLALPATVTDAKGNTTTYTYDAYSRLSRTNYPSLTTPGASSTTDYETLTYDALGHVTQRRLRDGTSISYSYDNLGRQTLLHPLSPVNSSDVDRSFTYDLLGRMLTASAGTGHTVTYTYDALGRKLSEASGLTGQTTSFQYDLAGRRTRLTWSDGLYVAYDYDVVGNMLAIRENGATSGAGVLASFSYDDLGRRTGTAYGNGTSDSYGYDSLSRLTSMGLVNTPASNSYTFAYNPANQLVTRTASNDNYAWTGAVAVNRAYTVNALNQYTASGSIVPTYDGRGNLTSAGPTSYTYDSKNELIAAGSNGLFYDALGHLDTITGSSTTRLAYDGSDLLTETDGSNATLRRYVHGPGTDEVIVWYEGSGTSNKRWLARDERGSVTLVTDASGAQVGINTYDDYGIPGASNIGRFQYTGQTWIPELGMYYYKARIYSPTLGRFLQTDPIGYKDGLNWYNYAHSDPINGRDPSGTLYYDTYDEYDGTWGGNQLGGKGGGYFGDITVTANRQGDSGISVGAGAVTNIGVDAQRRAPVGSPKPAEIVVKGKKRKNLDLNFVGNRPPGGPDDDEDPDDYEKYQNDLDKCRGMKGSAAANCYGAAERRRFARNNGKPLPPLAKSAPDLAAGAAIGTVLYWIISEGSRVLFPPRNLIPVP